MGAGEGGEEDEAEAGVAAAAVTGPGTPRTDLVTEVRVIIILPNKGLLGTRGLRKMLTSLEDHIKMLFIIMGLSKDLASIREPSTSPGSITKEPSRVTSTTTTITTRVKGGQIQGTTSSRAEAGAKCSSTAGTDTIMDTMVTVTRTMHMMVTVTRTRTTAARLTAAEDEVTTAVAGPAARDRGGPGDRRTSRTWPPRRPT